MPSVPKVGLNRVTPNALPGVRIADPATIQNFGGGQGLEAAGAAAGQLLSSNSLAQYAAHAKEQADDTAVQGAYAKTVTTKNALFYGVGAPGKDGYEPGVISQQGQNAFGAIDEYGGKFKDATDEIYNGLSNDTQKRMYQKIQAQQSNEFNENVQKHVYVESNKFADETVKSGVIASQNDAVSNYTDAGKVAQSIDIQKALISSNAQRTGVPAEVQMMQLKDAESTTHSQVINRMLSNGQDQLAQQHFDLNKGAISGVDSAKLEKSLEEGSLRGQSQRFVDQSTQPKYNDAGQAIPGTQPTMADVLAKTQDITDPKLRDATVARVKDFYSTQKAAEAMDSETQLKNAYTTIEQTKELPDPADFAKMAPAQKNAALAYLNTVRKGVEPETDWQKYYSLKQMASDPLTRDKFAKTDLMGFRNDLDNSRFVELVNAQDGVRNKSAVTQQKLDGYRTDSQIVNDTLKASGFNVNAKPGTTQAKDVAQFHSMVDARLASLQSTTGKKATNQQVQEIADELRVNAITQKGIFFNNTKSVFQLEPGQQFDLNLSDIPKSEIPKIKQVLQQNGKPVTDDAVLNVYKTHIQRTLK